METIISVKHLLSTACSDAYSAVSPLLQVHWQQREDAIRGKYAHNIQRILLIPLRMRQLLDYTKYGPQSPASSLLLHKQWEQLAGEAIFPAQRTQSLVTATLATMSSTSLPVTLGSSRDYDDMCLCCLRQLRQRCQSASIVLETHLLFQVTNKMSGHRLHRQHTCQQDGYRRECIIKFSSKWTTLTFA